MDWLEIYCKQIEGSIPDQLVLNKAKGEKILRLGPTVALHSVKKI